MKNFIFIIGTVFSISSYANSFDHFVGRYAVSSKPIIQAVNAKYCNRLFFSAITGIDIQSNTEGYKQSHVIYFLTPIGWSGFPISEYSDRSDWVPTVIHYAKVSGGASQATYEEGSRGPQFNYTNLTIQKTDSNYILNLRDERFEQGSVVSGCYYQIGLINN